jgi:ubiquinone/menaquinone biosynthesis C-methylase UbiE
MNVQYAKKILEETKKNYDSIAEDFSRTRDRLWAELDIFSKYAADNDKVLDLGCGNGRIYELFNGKRIDYYGVDFSGGLVAIAKRRYPQVNFQTADALNLPFPDNFFDKAFSIAVLHHIPSDELRLSFLSEAKRVLRPGGCLVITVWKFHKLESLFLIFKFSFLKLFGLSKLDQGDIMEPWGKLLKRYYHCYSRRELKRDVSEAGFRINDFGILKNERGNRQNIYIVAKKPL